nr:Ig-like domain-containing protein [Enterococcus sp. DIV0849a]
MHLSNVKLINADKTAPEQVKVSEIVNNSEETLIKGQGEPETLVQILSANSEMILESSTDSNGNFSLTIPKQQTGTILHMINKDIKGNTSASVVLVSN